ncbi:ankyrin repeat domain-containing protein [Acerihabitans sp. KWT182]|uniref:Ankyrin repeat domain-containing protein n=1 Tax=Acerihabitans sp. KWT182 TaxID=3157919 RepID=A0AAU7QCA9_9GAMM
MVDNQDWTVLMHAANCGNIELIRYLLSKGANRHFVNYRNETALSIALHKKDQKLIDALYEPVSPLADAKRQRLPASTLNILLLGDESAPVHPDNVKGLATNESAVILAEAIDNGDDTEKAPNVILDDNKSQVTRGDESETVLGEATTESEADIVTDKTAGNAKSVHEKSRDYDADSSVDPVTSKADGMSFLFSSRVLGDLGKNISPLGKLCLAALFSIRLSLY